MKILFCKVFGIGNAIMSLPAIKALHSLGHDIDVLIGNTQDDAGAHEIFAKFREYNGTIQNIWLNIAPGKYDTAILSIPYDGRWKNGVHFNAVGVLDGRTRPNPSTTGLISWKKHEVEYQMENANLLDYSGEIPDCSYREFKKDKSKKIYFGVGYKKDAAGFWKVKHWGNKNFADLAIEINKLGYEVICTGDKLDFALNIAEIIRLSKGIVKCPTIDNLWKATDILDDCQLYVGNDTGMGHIAAALGCSVITIHNLENSIIKSRPWTNKSHEFDGFSKQIEVNDVLLKVKEFLNG